MRYSLLAFFILILLLGISCRKNNTDSDLPPGSRLDSITTRDASNNSIVSGEKYKYDNTGKLVQYINGNRQTTQFRYDAQNRLTTISKYGITSPLAVDTLVYSANGQIVHSYRYASGTNMMMQSRTFVFDNSNRVILDTMYTSTSTPGVYAVYILKNYYDINDDQQSVVLYGSYAYNPYTPIPPTGLVRRDSVIYTHDGNENPFYKNLFAMYASTSQGYPFSKHNLISVKHFQGTDIQPSSSFSYVTTYYKNGLIRTQFTDNSAAGILTYVREFLYQ